MQIPLWAFFTSLFIALNWNSMASFLVKRNFTSAIKPYLPSLLSSRIPLQPLLQQQPQIRNLNTTSMSSTFLEQITARRSYYPLKKESPIDDKKIQEIVTTALLQVPSSFNSQSTRIVLLLKDEHDKFWELVKEVLKGVVPGDKFATTEAKLDMFKGAYGSVSSLTFCSPIFLHRRLQTRIS